MLELIRGALAPVGYVVAIVDRSMAAGSFHNAREAAGDSSRRRAAWSGVMSSDGRARKDRSVA